jgi:hypothetical protein
MTTLMRQLMGKTFIHPWVDYLLIGSVWSIVATAILAFRPSLSNSINITTLAVVILLVNSAHFAASTVKLYSDPRNFAKFPFVTMLLPLLAFAVVSLAIALPSALGRHVQALYLTWSPYHYAAQTYGLTVMYCFRSGALISPQEKRLVWWTCMLPFVRSFLGAPNSGLGWFVERDSLAALPGVAALLQFATDALLVLIFVVPLLLSIQLFRNNRKVMPLICVLMMFANGLWWTMLDFMDAFLLATVAHGLQYLAIVLVYHVKDRQKSAAKEVGWFRNAAKFYCACLILGYGLFYCWPHAYMWVGAGAAESLLLVIAVINIHHFIVDRYIWRAPTPAQAPLRSAATREQLSASSSQAS